MNTLLFFISIPSKYNLALRYLNRELDFLICLMITKFLSMSSLVLDLIIDNNEDQK